MSDELIASLERAVSAAPDDLELRLHLGALLVDAGRGGDAVGHAAAVLAARPGDERARELMTRALGGPPPAAPAPAADRPSNPSAASTEPVAAPADGFDWGRAEQDLGDAAAPMFAGSDASRSEVAHFDVEGAGLTLADVGGMEEVKKRLHAAFLAPMRNEKLRAMYRKSLRGGLMLYGPPGCGKTFVARALAGELGASFLSVALTDVLDMWVGQSEKNLHELFETARAAAPCVLFLDEVDAIGMRRSRVSSDAMRTTVNQLLTKLDGVAADNEGLFLLAATNQPWDVDPALRRPGRFDRTLLVLPPDAPARAAIWRTHLRERPVAEIDVARLAKMSDGFSGADIAHVCDAAAEIALLAAVEESERRGSAADGTDEDHEVRLIGQRDVEAALAEVRPSVGPWLETARNVATYANDDGSYDDLLAYLRKRRIR